MPREKQDEFQYGWIGFPGEEKDFLKNPESPFSFARVRERTVFRFFRLIGFTDDEIKSASEPIIERNNRMHASGRLYCASEEEFDKDLGNYLELMELIVLKQKEFLESIYEGLTDNYGDGYDFTYDDLEVDYILQYSFSPRELVLMAENKSDQISHLVCDTYGFLNNK